MNETWLAHHGILGQKWGIRRFQNEDGSLTPAGEKHVGLKTDGTGTKKPKQKLSGKVGSSKPIQDLVKSKYGQHVQQKAHKAMERNMVLGKAVIPGLLSVAGTRLLTSVASDIATQKGHSEVASIIQNAGNVLAAAETIGAAGKAIKIKSDFKKTKHLVGKDENSVFSKKRK